MEWIKLSVRRTEDWRSSSPAGPYTAHRHDIQLQLSGCCFLFNPFMDLKFLYQMGAPA